MARKLKCRFCGSTDIIEKYPANNRDRTGDKTSFFACTNCGFGRHGKIVSCRNCGLVYVAEKLGQKTISTYYEVAEDPLYFAEQPARKITFNHYLDKLEKVFPQKGRLLDVGTNTGLFVRLALDRGWQAQGLEPNRWATKYARDNYHIKLVNKPFTKHIFAPASFDVITMWDVIEHFVDPIKELKTIFWYLKPRGIFVFSTVDPHSLMARTMGSRWSWYMEMHRVFFDRPTVRRYLATTGFRKIVLQSHWRHLSLGYLSTRLAAVSPRISNISSKIIAKAGLDSLIVPYYANDLYDCFAFKSS